MSSTSDLSAGVGGFVNRRAQALVEALHGAVEGRS
jgi:hypothetical protein